VTAREAAIAHTVKGKKYASTTLSLPKHQDKYNTGTMTRTPRHPSRCLLAVNSGLSGSAQHAARSGKLRLHDVWNMTLVVLDAIFRWEIRKHSQRLKQCNTLCYLSGTMSATSRMASIPAAPLLAAQSLCIGFAKSVQRDSCISTKCDLVTVLKDMVAVVHVVLASKFAIATPWKLNIP